MKFKVVVHEAEEGGYWAEVPATGRAKHLMKSARLNPEDV